MTITTKGLHEAHEDHVICLFARRPPVFVCIEWAAKRPSWSAGTADGSQASGFPLWLSACAVDLPVVRTTRGDVVRAVLSIEVNQPSNRAANVKMRPQATPNRACRE